MVRANTPKKCDLIEYHVHFTIGFTRDSVDLDLRYEYYFSRTVVQSWFNCPYKRSQKMPDWFFRLFMMSSGKSPIDTSLLKSQVTRVERYQYCTAVFVVLMLKFERAWCVGNIYFVIQKTM
jgi:hypothetical protein